MSSYTQLTRGRRYEIRVLLKAGYSLSKLATIMKVHKSTLSRELRRNRGQKGYRPHQLDHLSQFFQHQLQIFHCFHFLMIPFAVPAVSLLKQDTTN